MGVKATIGKRRPKDSRNAARLLKRLESMATGKLLNISLTLLRFLLAAWVGAAVLYVITSVAEQVSPNFDSRTRDQLATIRFPIYYQFGACLYVGTAILAIIVWQCLPGLRRSTAVLALIVVSGAIFTWDYFEIYLPLQDLIIPAGQVRTQEFVRLHTLSRNVNMLHLSLMLLSGLLICMPLPAAHKEADAS